jgi:hypothetical protein
MKLSTATSMNELKTALREQSKSEAPLLTIDCFFLLSGGDRFHSQFLHEKRNHNGSLSLHPDNELLFLVLKQGSVFIPLGALVMVPTMVL